MYLLNTGMFAGRRVPAKRTKERQVPDKAFKVSQAGNPDKPEKCLKCLKCAKMPKIMVSLRCVFL